MGSTYDFPGQADVKASCKTSYPPNVGILAMDIFFPQQYVEQSKLEKYDNVSEGKYTKGLGQDQLAFCTTSQDIYSLMLSGVSSFMKRFNVDYNSIGRLEVGTETIMDHSKAIKTVLMQLFEPYGNTDIEGIDCTNACYGGTNAVFNSVNWIESSAWDGRYAMVVCGDIAEYASGPARPTSGAGVVVMLLGANAPLVIESSTRSTHMSHAWDFYKPNMTSPFPVVDGHLSQTCYLNALDICFARYVRKYEQITGKPFVFNDDASNVTGDYYLFHSPYNKLVQKSYARLYYLATCFDKLGSGSDGSSASAIAQVFANTYKTSISEVLANASTPSDAYTATLTDRGLEKTCMTLATTGYTTRVLPSCQVPKRLGNMYTGSLWACLLSLVQEKHTQLVGKSCILFSYGSGLAASMFGIRVPDTKDAEAALRMIADRVDVFTRLDARIEAEPSTMNVCMDDRAASYVAEGVFTPPKSAYLDKEEYYLVEKDVQGKRSYKQNTVAATTTTTTTTSQ